MFDCRPVLLFKEFLSCLCGELVLPIYWELLNVAANDSAYLFEFCACFPPTTFNLEIFSERRHNCWYEKMVDAQGIIELILIFILPPLAVFLHG